MKFPIFIENSRVPKILSFFTPITIGAINLVFFVFARGEVEERTKRHETIHFWQWMELGIVGFAPLYFLFWLIGLWTKGNGQLAYRLNPFEMEAYEHENDDTYIGRRPWYAWRKFMWSLRE